MHTDTLEEAARVEAAVQTGPFFIVLNPGSGRKGLDETCAIIDRVMKEAGRKHTIHQIKNVRKLRDIADQVVSLAQEQGGTVVVAGGDGTINAVAQSVLGSGCPFGVIPKGTFNYFGRTHGISEDTETAVRQLLSSKIHRVQVGQVNGKLFLVNASLGLYPKLLEDREFYKQKYGRSRVVAWWAAIRTVALAHRQLRLQISHRGMVQDLRTLTLFVGNNRLQLEQVGMPEAQAPEHGELAALMLRPVGTLTMLGLMLRGAWGHLGDSDNVMNFSFRDLNVTPRGWYGMQKMKVATDGEVLWLKPPLRFRVADESLLLLKPEPTPTEGT